MNNYNFENVENPNSQIYYEDGKPFLKVAYDSHYAVENNDEQNCIVTLYKIDISNLKAEKGNACLKLLPNNKGELMTIDILD